MSTEFAGVTWFKSSHSGGRTDCVEVAWLEGGRVGVRDSKDESGPSLAFAPEAWFGFTSALRGSRPAASD